VLKEDIIRHMNGAPAATTPVSAPPPPPVHAPTPVTVGTEDRVVPLSGYSRVMVKTMTLANTIPHFGYADEVVVDNLLAFRKDLKHIAETRGIKLTLMPIIIKVRKK
jgi:2-oxoisovalerate dehydrogenase E2 component (dihydrolipoyl transacylase)